MAKFTDEREAVLEEGEEFDNLTEDSTEETTEQGIEEPNQQQEENLPEKYKGKSVKDIIAMHQNAESMMGRQSQEVGELRRVVDDFIQTQTVTQKQSPTVSDDSDDDLEFFENPKQAISKILDNHPALKQSQEFVQSNQRSKTKEALAQKFPNFTTYLKDPEFAKWIGASQIRTQLLQQADQNFDYEAAKELFSNWEDRKGTVTDVKNNEKAALKQQIKKGATGSARGTSPKSRKMYRRADIIELMQKDPQRYQALAGEIRQAYTEGRVR